MSPTFPSKAVSLQLFPYSLFSHAPVSLFSSSSSSPPPSSSGSSTDELRKIHQQYAGRRRFYENVTVEKIKEGGFEVTLDGRRLKTPARKHLVLPNLELAHVLAAEWDFQEVLSDRGIEPATMPFMTLVSSAIDQADGEPSYYIERILTYLPTDSALFFTTRDDRILLKKQRKQLIPLVEFVRDIFGIELLTAEDGSIGKLIHPSESIRKFRDIIESLDPFVLSCMHAATIECKSAIIALALLCRRIDMDQARAASRIEEEFQVEIWGVVEGGHDMDRLNNSVKLAAVSTFMNLYWSTETTDQFARAWSSKRN